jgi:hydrogenase maturation protease
VEVEVRFLQLVQRDVEIPQDREGGSKFVAVAKVEMDGRILSSWQEATERRVAVGPLVISALLSGTVRKEFNFEASRETEPIYNQDGELAARFVRHRERLRGRVEFSAERVAPELFKLSASVVNDSAFSGAAACSHEQAMLSSFLSTHKILRCKDGQFISLTDPPDELRDAAAGCKNVGTWPVLASEQTENSDVLLSSPIILYDYAEIAPESAGDLFDGTEIDEILVLRILTMTDEEKREMRSVDDRTRAVLERTESLGPEHFMKLHGVMRAAAPVDEERS